MSDTDEKPREFWIELTEHKSMISNGVTLVTNGPIYFDVSIGTRTNLIATAEIPNSIHVIEKSAYEALSIKIQRTVNAAYSALLEISAWIGIPEHKRAKQIEELMSNVKYCAEHDLSYVDHQQLKTEIARLEAERDSLLIVKSEMHNYRDKWLTVEKERDELKAELEKVLSTKLQVIPDGSFVIIKTDYPDDDDLCDAIASLDFVRDWNKKGLLGGAIVSNEVDFNVMTDEDLADMGLQRISKSKT